MNKDRTEQKAQIIYLSHGGGPLPILGDASHGKMIQFMKNLPQKIEKPDAVVVFSAHWEEDIPTVQSGEAPGMMYDYYGFPEAAYRIQYPCKGDSGLAARIGDLFEKAGIEYRLDGGRPYDHGSYIPLLMMYPDADIPVLQVSLRRDLDPAAHLEMGKAFRPLLWENILFIGSGFSFHNMRQFDFSGKNAEDALNDAFQDQLIEICCGEKDEEKRQAFLADWERIPGARYCHPREEHLLPLLVCAGLATDPGAAVFDDCILGKRGIAILWKQKKPSSS